MRRVDMVGDQLTLGAWLSMTKENNTPEDMRWFGIEITREQWDTIHPSILNTLGGNTLILVHDVRNKIHADVYTNQNGINKIYAIVDDKLCKKKSAKAV